MATGKSLFLQFLLTTALVIYIGPSKILPSFLSFEDNVPEIHSPAGAISGFTMLSRNGRGIFAYQGIPYAEPPLNGLRFKRPKALKQPAWEGVFAATSSSTPCVQKNENPLFASKGSEDCLQLNVYVPKVDTKKPLPVMVWLHGGGFTSGDSSDRVYGPKYLLDKDVILVTVNYRLGIFGFLTLGNDDAPGNLGMWDQHEGLKWVQKNIASFGGDPNKVTIFGESAGGWSVSYQMASRKNKGLFHAAIVQSGPIDLGGMKVDLSRSIPDIHSEFSERMGCPIDDKAAAVKCLQKKTPEALLEGLNMFDQCNTIAMGVMAFPIVWSAYDDHALVTDPFFADHPREVFKTGKFNLVPTMVGSTKDEGVLHTAPLLVNPNQFDDFKNNWDECVANSFLGEFFLSKPVSKRLVETASKVKKAYFGDEDITLDNDGFKRLTDAFTDSEFFHGTDVLAKQLSQRVKTFYYQFDHLGSFSLSDIFGRKPLDLLWLILKKALGFHDSLKLGVSHGDDILYLFSMSTFRNIFPEEKDQKMIDFMVDLWTNFATYHDPTPSSHEWPALGTRGQNYVRLVDSKIILEADSVRDKRLSFWHKTLKY